MQRASQVNAIAQATGFKLIVVANMPPGQHLALWDTAGITLFLMLTSSCRRFLHSVSGSGPVGGPSGGAVRGAPI